MSLDNQQDNHLYLDSGVSNYKVHTSGILLNPSILKEIDFMVDNTKKLPITHIGAKNIGEICLKDILLCLDSN